MDEITLYLLGYDTAADDARRGLPYLCAEGETRQYRDGYAAGRADVAR
jgi:hypothetical protein